MVLEVLGVEDGQAVVDIALEAAGDREAWDSGGLRPLLRTHLVHLGGTRGGIPWKASSISHMRKALLSKYKATLGRGERG